MADAKYIRASNGGGEAVRSIVVEDRGIDNMALNVDSVLNYPHDFIGTVGTLVNEVFDSDTVTVFYGHIDGSIVMIDSFAPGYTDIGNTEGQVLVIKPTTAWADEVAMYVDGIVGAVWHNGDGAPTEFFIDGDYYLDTTNYDVYQQIDHNWGTPICNLKGATGPANSLSIGTVTSGTTPSATITGTAPNQTLNLVMEKGDKGDKGNDGLGVPAGGTTNQLLTKNSNADNDTSWKDAPVSLPDQTGADGKYLTTDGTKASWNDIGPTTAVFNEVPTGLVNGSNTSFTTASEYISGTLNVFKNGIRLKAGGADYTETTGGFTMVTAPATGTVLLVDYLVGSAIFTQGLNNFLDNQTVTGLVNSSNKEYTTPSSYIGGTLSVYINGIKQAPTTHFTETTPASGVFTMSDAPITGDNILVSYQHNLASTGDADTVDNFHASATPTANTIPVLDANGEITVGIINTPIFNVSLTGSLANDYNLDTMVIASAVIDTASGVSGDTYVIPETGIYLLGFNSKYLNTYATSSNGRIEAYIYKGAGPISEGFCVPGGSNTFDPTIQTSIIINLSAGDVITFQNRMQSTANTPATVSGSAFGYRIA